jgi:hypothetical protein
MGANRLLATPDLYPAVFHAVVRNGSGVIYSSDTPWTMLSCAKRFRLFLNLLRKTPSHPLYGAAKARWSVRPRGGAVEIARAEAASGRDVTALNAALVARGLAAEEGEDD